jgi:hypothetical protein
MNKSARWASRVGLTLASVLAAILNGSPLAVPVLLLMVYLLSVLVTQGQEFFEAVGPKLARFGRALVSELAHPIGRVR